MSALISIATLVILLSLTSKLQALSESKCDADKCVPISECPHLWKLISKEIISPHDKNTLREAHCGFQQNNNIPKVCCEPEVCKPSANLPDRHSGCCGKYSSKADRIIRFRGKNITIKQYPWLAIINFLYLNEKGNTKTHCGGVLISSKFVLTAAGCLVYSFLKLHKPINVRLGDFDRNIEGNCSLTEDGGKGTHRGVLMPIEKIIPHPEYKVNSLKLWNDIGLIKMKGSAPYTDTIRPICLADRDITSDLSSSPNFKFVVAAWYRIDEGLFGSQIKIYQKVPYVNLTVCQSKYDRVLWENQICAGGEAHKDPCKVDVAAPLMYENDKVFDVHGVQNLRTQCGLYPDTRLPTVYTKVFKYTAWIRSTVDNELKRERFE